GAVRREAVDDRSQRNAGTPPPPPGRRRDIARSRRSATGREEDVADAGALEPDAGELGDSIAAGDGGGGGRGGIVHHHVVAVDAGQHDEMAARRVDGGAGELAGGVTD